MLHITPVKGTWVWVFCSISWVYTDRKFKKKTIRLHGVLLRIEKQKAVESNKEKDMKEFSLDAISSPFNKLQLLSENSINANDTMRKEMEFHVYFASQ